MHPRRPKMHPPGQYLHNTNIDPQLSRGSAAEAAAFRSGRSRPAGWAVRDLSDKVFGTIFPLPSPVAGQNPPESPSEGAPLCRRTPPHPQQIRRPGATPERPKTVSESPKTAQASLQTAPDRSQTLNMASRRPKTPSSRPKRRPRAPPRGPQEVKFIGFSIVFEGFWRSRHFGFPTLQDGPRGPPYLPKTAQEAPKRAPRRPKRAPRQPKRPPGRPKRAPGRPQEGAQRRNPNGHFELSVPRGPQEALRGP